MKEDNNSFKDLILFDRGYPSQQLISELIDLDIYFVMRLKSNVFKKKLDSGKQNQIIELKYNNKTYNARIVKFNLNCGVEEILITNIFNESISISGFKELYFMRRGIEIKYDELKNRIAI